VGFGQDRHPWKKIFTILPVQAQSVKVSDRRNSSWKASSGIWTGQASMEEDFHHPSSPSAKVSDRRIQDHLSRNPTVQGYVKAQKKPKYVIQTL